MNIYMVELLDGRYEPASLLGVSTSLKEAVEKIAELDYEKLDNPLQEEKGILITEIEVGNFSNDNNYVFYNYKGEEIRYK